MKHLSISTALLFLIHGCSAFSIDARSDPAVRIREMLRKVMMPVVYSVPGMDEVKRT